MKKMGLLGRIDSWIYCNLVPAKVREAVWYEWYTTAHNKFNYPESLMLNLFWYIVRGYTLHVRDKKRMEEFRRKHANAQRTS